MNELKQQHKIFAVALLIVLISLGHYTVNHSLIYVHDLSRRLYYLPLIMASIWFGKRGGISSALAITVIYSPHALHTWYGSNPRFIDNLIEIVFFNILGYLLGSYIDKKNEQRRRAEKSAWELERAYARLQENTEKIVALEDELRFADRLSILGELSASLAHEVRNPLAGIHGSAEILEMRLKDDEDSLEFVAIQLSEIKRLNQVVENYLTLSRKKSKVRQPVNLNDLLSGTIALLRISAKNSHIRINSNRLSGQPEVYTKGDPVQLKQAFLNIALNGLHAMSNGGQLKFSFDEITDDKVTIKISDNGGGIAEENHDKIFDTFFTTKQKGSGLGLAIVKRIIDRHRGRLWFESSPRGTKFFIELERLLVN